VNSAVETRHSQETMALVQSVHPEKSFFYLPGFRDETLLAGLYGLDAADYAAIKTEFAAAARGAAQELLADAAFARRVDNLPFSPETTLAAVGDSFTDDLQSWLEIVRHLLDLRRPRDNIRVINAAVSARTTADVLHYLPATLAQRPDWLFCLAGSGDAKRSGPEPTKTMVGIAETAANLAAIRRNAAAQGVARFVWITPATVDEERLAAYPPFRFGPSRWRNDDLIAVGDVVRAMPDTVVNVQVQSVFALPPDSTLLGADGLHPSLAGQTAIARAVVEQLSA
jgi:acyl-CoA thioesterase-1